MLRLYPSVIQRQEVQELYVNKNVTKTLTFLRNLLKEVIIKTFVPKNNLVKKATQEIICSGNNALEILLKSHSKINKLKNNKENIKEYSNIFSDIKKCIISYPIMDIFLYIQKYRLSVKEYLRWVLELMQALLLDLSFIRDTYIYSSVYIIRFLLIYFIRQSDIIILIDNLIDLTLEINDIITKVIDLDKLKLYNDFKEVFQNLIFLMLLIFILHSILKFFIPLIIFFVIYVFKCYTEFRILDDFFIDIFNYTNLNLLYINLCVFYLIKDSSRNLFNYFYKNLFNYFLGLQILR